MAPNPDPYAAALALARAGRLAEALKAVEAVLADTPAAAGLAIAAQLKLELGDARAALADADRALALDPENVRGHAARGDALQALGRATDALAAYDRALAREPGHLAALGNRGAALIDLERFDEALASYEAVLARAPQMAPANANRARVLADLGRHAEALEAAERAVALQPAYAKGWIRRGGALYGLGRFDDALESFRKAAGLDPRAYEALTGSASALQALGRYEEALTALDAAEALDPDGPAAPYQRALLKLMTRDFAGGWRDYEARWRAPAFLARSAGFVTDALRPRLAIDPAPDDFAGRSVLVVGEQGVGDQVMHASLLPDLAAIAREVTWICDRRLHRLFRASFANVRFLDSRDAGAPDASAYDITVAAGSLGGAFRRREPDFPGAAYLRPTSQTVAEWAAKLGARRDGLRIGLSWAGGTDRTDRVRRSIPLDRLEPLLRLTSCDFVSLQYGPAAEDATGWPVRVFPSSEIDDFEALAGLIANLDLVVSVQTAAVHLAGALGQAAYALVPVRPEWRYGAAGEAMPWYGSVRIFRQDTRADWAAVIDEVARALAAQAG